MQFEPMNDCVLVKLIKDDEKSSGGIVLPQNISKSIIKGKVFSRGPGRMLESGQRQEIDLKRGEEVIIIKPSRGEFPEIDGYTFVSERDILAVIRE